MDDYPRAAPSDEDRHVDLLAWVIAAGRWLEELRELAEEPEEVPGAHARRDAELLESLVHNHWSDKRKAFCDVGTVLQAMPGGRVRGKGLECHIGYVSILPLSLQLLAPDSPFLDGLLRKVRSKRHLWSPMGLRSLSKSDPLFGREENYWRGAVWININYLTVQALQYYGSVPGPLQEQCAQLAVELRANLKQNILTQFEATGYLWENYHALTGVGRGTHPFTGWTALFPLM